ncbi:hypothetical protein Pla123a_22120 [Posidoniimonas polymericola]|uniref:Uncharacterized protein n=1 Tax=Posidoniimonas polymericola TaxID=2528002 RepID=A0A5C5YRH9_9BACT|nr:hypothetical protein [Posidoniimonas polymericola]TWT77551.1 hypothetical protein Pla123a_22120 [Posidoniimonas polymericola]
MKSRRTIWLLVALLAVAAFGLAWFGEGGGGEYRDSPDGQWQAEAMTVSGGTWFHGRIRSVRIKVTDNSTGLVVWQVRLISLPGESVPELRDRSKRFVSWDAASTVATIDLGQMGVVRLPVP